MSAGIPPERSYGRELVPNEIKGEQSGMPWQILVVDDEEDIHSLVRLMASDLTFAGFPLQLVHASSAKQARERLAANDQFAIILLDVVMETDTSGLDLVHDIRTELKNSNIRIVLFTGQPGKAPELQVLNDYDVNGYIDKAEVTSQLMANTLLTSLRNYQNLKTIATLSADQRKLSEMLEQRNQELKENNLSLQSEVMAKESVQQSLLRANEELEKGVTERTRELVVARDVAESASRAKTDFISSISHEFRTPLNAIIGFSDILVMEGADPLTEKQRGYVAEVRQAGGHLVTLVEDILDLSRIEAGDQRPDLEPALIRPLIDDCIALIAPLAREKHVKIRFDDSLASSTTVMSNSKSIKQVMINLMSNAIKYNQSGGVVVVSCEDAGSGRLLVKVADTGIGIPENLQGRIFEPFDRLAAANSNIHGAGLGLTISMRLLKLMGSELVVDSQDGIGSNFYFVLPQLEDA